MSINEWINYHHQRGERERESEREWERGGEVCSRTSAAEPRSVVNRQGPGGEGCSRTRRRNKKNEGCNRTVADADYGDEGDEGVERDG